jgi:cobaltochelatase CobS
MATIKELQDKLARAKSDKVKEIIQAEIQKAEFREQASQGNEVAQLLLALKDSIDAVKKGGGTGGGGGVSQAEVEMLVSESLKKNKITLDDLDGNLRNFLTAQAKVQLELKVDNLTSVNYQTVVGGSVPLETVNDPLFQKILSDAVSMNNVYLYGTAGSGKTYIATQIAKFLNYNYIEINCNQYTSPLEIIGGQTIDGYQEGKLIRAWGNLTDDGRAINTNYNGAVLCIDEIPKIDPNTAGLFNSALAKVKDIIYKTQSNIKEMPTIENGKGDKIPKGNLIIIATGNLKLNELSTEYEANFKQDLSLQDRFAGSTYRVDYNYQSEWESMKGFAFIFIALLKLREKIIEQRYTGYAFVSRRILSNLKQTYKTFRSVVDKKGVGSQVVDDALTQPKTLIDGLNSFLGLFKPEQKRILMEAMDYDGFIRIVEAKNRLPINELDTPQELAEVQVFIVRNKINLANNVA